MNNQAVQSAQFGGWLAQGIASAMRTANVLLAHVRETIGGGSARDTDDLLGMNAYMLRDIGAESSIGQHSSANRDLQYPRL
jgi:hypothetical protein